MREPDRMVSSLLPFSFRLSLGSVWMTYVAMDGCIVAHMVDTERPAGRHVMTTDQHLGMLWRNHLNKGLLKGWLKAEILKCSPEEYIKTQISEPHPQSF